MFDTRRCTLMSQTLAIANQKGGVGKTTTAINLSASLAALGFSTLLIDLDPQGNASSGLGVDHTALQQSIYNVLAGEVRTQDAILDTAYDNLRLLPATTDLAAAELELVGVESGREFFVQKIIDDVRDAYDYILLDCPPSLGLLTLNALVAANSVLIPVQAEYYALEGLARLQETLELVRQQLNPSLSVHGLVLTMYDGRNNLARQVEEDVRNHFGNLAYRTMIPRNVRLSEAPSFGQPIIAYDVASRGAQAYLDLAREFAERGGILSRNSSESRPTNH